ncbi:MAG: ATP:cob(I)alamin adenosyltransferase [Crocinitomicaceae bacterium]|jgi:cob(I)alamin adenosyltransferase|nr:ATP:cob(I)alamin adenosyltransferase [Crocinitomicaceae bacterium]
MKIYTKKGDSGTTQLIGGTRIPKHSLRIESYGTVDELNSWIGLIRDQEINQLYRDQLIEIQDRLFTVGSNLAVDNAKSNMKLPQVSEKDVEFLEQAMDTMDAMLPEMKSFVLPGGHTTVSYCHLARCVCRRAERNVTHLNENEAIEAVVMKYLNRLSDYLFVLSRKLTQDLHAHEQPWKPRMD